MNKEQRDTLLALLPNYAVPCGYFRDKYALDQLARLTQKQPQKVQSLKTSSGSMFLQKPAVRKVLATFSDGIVLPERLLGKWPENTLPFNWTVGSWGTDDPSDYKWHQTTRFGHNLVLQLNLDPSVVDEYYRLTGNNDISWFSDFDHPSAKKQVTLAWARLDFDLEGDTVLIEEVQSDFVKEVKYWAEKYEKRRSEGKTLGYPYGYGLIQFWEKALLPSAKLWEEAMLATTLDFIEYELGYRKVYMHTWESGCRLKHIDGSWLPPKSLYTKLPKKFGFQLTCEHPDFLKDHKPLKRRKKKDENTEWWRWEW
ncbi:MAG TPA: hypothetical protein DCR93_03570 [Cytophagales bacterium]|nr:hypothetical protein [Cytophagales bacterium]HAP58616.1 hypothetical protein [Cytophagales bacterium]